MMLTWVKCPRCAAVVPHHSTVTAEAKLCGRCVDGERRAVELSIRADLRARGVPDETANAIALAAVGTIASPDDPIAPAAESRLEALSVIGAGAWERWVASVDHSPGRVERLLELRPYRRQVVRVILEALTRDAGVVWD